MKLARRNPPREDRLERTRVELEQMRALLARYMPPPIETDTGDLVLPCPYCAVLDGHVGSCRLSTMSTGQTFEIVARPR